MDILLSGFFGAVIASCLIVFYNYITEQVRFRKEIMLKVVEWGDDIYDRLQEIHVAKDIAYNEEELHLEQAEYRVLSRESKKMLMSSKMSATVALVYGEKEELQKINAFQGELLKIYDKLINATKKTWVPERVNESIHRDFKMIIDPLRHVVSQRFLHGTRINSILGDLLKSQCPSFYSMVQAGRRIKLLKAKKEQKS